ncbi:winged helix-turn-helix domain-containing protein, partial [Agrobacterium pusense]|uniref:winged helix-turn-helix domain-containing protein n=1 Tax=Agrobacterium pusense TaxID=648995 RepID=UPI003FD283F3
WLAQQRSRCTHAVELHALNGLSLPLTDHQRPAFAQATERESALYLDSIVRQRLCDLAQRLWVQFRVSVREQTLSREVRAMGYRNLAVRPKHHVQGLQAIEDFIKASQPLRQTLPPERPEKSA